MKGLKQSETGEGDNFGLARSMATLFRINAGSVGADRERDDGRDGDSSRRGRAKPVDEFKQCKKSQTSSVRRLVNVELQWEAGGDGRWSIE